jgi:hypothetical protein
VYVWVRQHFPYKTATLGFRSVLSTVMKRLAIGAALGGFAAYLYDPEFGVERRARLSSQLRAGRASALQAGRAASPIIESARPVARRMTNAVSRVDWTQPLKRVRPAATLRRMLGAAVVGGALVYFMDPVKGSQRRQSALEAGRRTARQLAIAVKPMPGRVSDRLADSIESFKSKAS